MLNVTKELTALARKLGYTGKAPDTVAKAINAITASVGEGGGEGGEGDGLVVPTFSDQDDEITCDMTFSQVNEAIKAKKCFYALLDGFHICTYQLREYREDEFAVFSFYSLDGGVSRDDIVYGADETITIDGASYPE